jgi:hypothetical protein
MLFTLRPRLVLALIALAYGCGWVHARPDIVALRMVQAALVTIEQGEPAPESGVRFGIDPAR